MGGAIGMAVRKAGAANRVMGVADKPETIEKARLLGAVDDATMDLREGVRDADLVILALPVSMIPEVVQAVIPACREGTLITDIGSTKAAVVPAVEKLIAQLKAPVYFVGSHPIAGSEKSGIEAAGEVQLTGAPCALTSTANTDGESYHRVDEFWKALGMKTLRLSPEEHDAVLARSSHLPHLLAFALLGVQTERSMQLSGPGLRDMVRLAGSDVRMWTDIFAQNATEVVHALKEYIHELQEIEAEIELLTHAGTPGAESARERIFRILADARQRHDKRFAEDSTADSARQGDADIRSRDTQVL